MEKISNLFGHIQRPQKKRRITERGELLDFFLSVLNPERSRGKFKLLDHKRLSFMLAKIPTQDLYYIKSSMIDMQRRNGTTSACKWFYWSLKNPPETKQL